MWLLVVMLAVQSPSTEPKPDPAKPSAATQMPPSSPLADPEAEATQSRDLMFQLGMTAAVTTAVGASIASLVGLVLVMTNGEILRRGVAGEEPYASYGLVYHVIFAALGVSLIGAMVPVAIVDVVVMVLLVLEKRGMLQM